MWIKMIKNQRLGLLTVPVVSLVLSFVQVFVVAQASEFERIGTGQGLSHASITALVQDHAGDIWVGSQAGLNRFDGQGFVTYEHIAADPSAISGDWIWSMVVDHQGQLWVGSNNGGLSRFNRRESNFSNYRHDPDDPQSLRSNQVRFVFEDSYHQIWVGTKGGGLSRLDEATDTFIHYRHDATDSASLPSDSVNYIAEWDQKLYVATESGLAVLEDGQTQFKQHVGGVDRNVRVVREHQGKLLIGTHANGLRVFDPATSSVTEFRHTKDDLHSLPDDLVRDILIDHLGSVWIATDQGLANWSAETQGFVTFRHASTDQYSLSDNRIDSLFEDDKQMLWVGTYAGLNLKKPVDAKTPFLLNASANSVDGSFDAKSARSGDRGISSHRDGLFQRYDVESGHLSNDIVTTIAESKTGDIWIGTYGGGLNRLTHSNVDEDVYHSSALPDQNLADKRIMALAIDETNNVWIGTRTAGLYRLGPGLGEVAHFAHDPADAESIGANAITAIFPTDNAIWVGTYGGGLNRLDLASEKITRYIHQANDDTTLGSNRVLTIYRDRQSVFWIGTEDGGLNRFNPDSGTFTRYMHDPKNPDSISHDTAWEILEATDGSLWVGTLAAGLNRWSAVDRQVNRPVFKHYTKGSGLSGDTIYGILESPSGAIWLSGDKGLSELNPDTDEIRHFDKNDGIGGDEFNFGARLRNHAGHLMFGGAAGIVVF